MPSTRKISLEDGRTKPPTDACIDRSPAQNDPVRAPSFEQRHPRGMSGGGRGCVDDLVGWPSSRLRTPQRDSGALPQAFDAVRIEPALVRYERQVIDHRLCEPEDQELGDWDTADDGRVAFAQELKKSILHKSSVGCTTPYKPPRTARTYLSFLV